MADDLHAELSSIATMIASEVRTDVHTLTLSERDFDPADNRASKPALSSSERRAMFAALPKLARLVLCGDNLFERIAHPALVELELVGQPTPRAFDEADDLPSLLRLRWALPSDRHGVAMDPLGIEPLLSGRATPRLVDLDLSALTLDGDIFEVAALRRGSLSTSLRILRLLAVDGDEVVRTFPKLERVVVESLDGEQRLLAKGIQVTRTKRKRESLVTLVGGPTVIQHGDVSTLVKAYHLAGLTDKTALSAASLLDDAKDRRAIERLHLKLATGALTRAGLRRIVPALGRLPCLKALFLEMPDKKVQIGAEEIDVLASSLRALHGLALRNFAASDAAWAALGRAIEALRIQELDLTSAELPSVQALKNLAGHRTLRSLTLIGAEGITPNTEGGAALAALIRHLNHLNVRMIPMDAGGMAAVTRVVGKSHLESLHIGSNDVDSRAMTGLLAAATRCKVTHLVLGKVCDDEDGRRSLVALLDEGRLTDLNLRQSLEPEGSALTEAFIEGLRANRTLTRLELSSCSFDAKHAAAFARAVRVHPTLRELHAPWIDVPDRAAFAAALGSSLTSLGTPTWLIELLLTKSKVRVVDASGRRWNFRPERARPFYAAAKASKTLERLDLRGTKHEPADVKALLDFIMKAPALRELDVRSCELRPADYKSLLTAIAKKPGARLDRLYARTPSLPPNVSALLDGAARSLDVVIS